MDEELRCPSCAQLYSNPVLLPCGHALCLNCALQRQGPVSCRADVTDESDTSGSDIDKLSVVSETDSGVICGGGSGAGSGSSSSIRPPSFLSSPDTASTTSSSTTSSSHHHQQQLSLRCLKCHKLVLLDDSGAYNLPRFRVMQKIVERFAESRQMKLKCQLCEESQSPRDATVACEQCEVLYCDPCRERCHPLRGPLAKHSLLAATRPCGQLTRPGVKTPGSKLQQSACPSHGTQSLVNFCLDCKMAVCNTCVQEDRHRAHELHALSTVSKNHKTELSFHLQQLTERVKAAADYIHQLKTVSDDVTTHCCEFETAVGEQCEQLIDLVRQRKEQLTKYLRTARDERIRSLKHQVSDATSRLQQTNGLLMFCIEALKEQDDSAFLQIGQLLTHRVASFDLIWGQDMTSDLHSSPDLNLSLDTESVRDAVSSFHFIQMKPCQPGEDRKPAAPGAPSLSMDSCKVDNNAIRLSWRPHATSRHEGFIVQLDDGTGFKDTHCGRESSCRLTGLHFNTRYRCRVKGYNSTGDGKSSDIVSLQTAEVAWFTFDAPGQHRDIRLTSDNTSATCDGYESRVVLGSVGFSRGVHFWEFSVDRFDGNADPAFGMARAGVNRELMLGKDGKGWSMYIDDKRSWLMHQDLHSGRVEGGIKTGDTVGVLLNLKAQKITFYVNEVIQGRIDFGGLQGTFYPAVSVNRNVAITLHTALDPPSDAEV